MFRALVLRRPRSDKRSAAEAEMIRTSPKRRRLTTNRICQPCAENLESGRRVYHCGVVGADDRKTYLWITPESRATRTQPCYGTVFESVTGLVISDGGWCLSKVRCGVFPFGRTASVLLGTCSPGLGMVFTR